MKRMTINLFVLLCIALVATRTVLADETTVTEAMRLRGLVSAGDPARI